MLWVMARRDLDLDEHWRVRVVMRGGGMLHFASFTEPVKITDSYDGLSRYEWEEITHPAYGDTFGHISWPDVAAVSWRQYVPEFER